jgi:hypothetical protein
MSYIVLKLKKSISNDVSTFRLYRFLVYKSNCTAYFTKQLVCQRVKQRLKCYTGKACNCLIQLLLTTFVSTEEHVFLNEIFGELFISRNVWPPCSSDLTAPDFYLWGAAKSAVCRDRPRTLNELKTAIIECIRIISQENLQKVFENKIKQVQPCIDARGHHFQHLL